MGNHVGSRASRQHDVQTCLFYSDNFLFAALSEGLRTEGSPVRARSRLWFCRPRRSARPQAKKHEQVHKVGGQRHDPLWSRKGAVDVWNMVAKFVCVHALEAAFASTPSQLTGSTATV